MTRGAVEIEGQRVGVVDTDLQTPGIHTLFGLDAGRMTRSLNNYLGSSCHIW
jgi:MinD-like ATPase involved in chromosome partitioning or flagellar assembly